MKACDVCETAFTPAVPWQKRCSAKCNSIASNTRRRRDPSRKICRTCGLEMSSERFEPAHRHCIECEQLYALGRKRCKKCWEVKDLDDFYMRPTRASGRESRCKACRARQSKKLNADPVRKVQVRDRKYRSKYGLTEAEVQAMRVEQDYCCAICGKKPDRLNVDHDHRTGAVRALLCSNCNSILGHCDDNIAVLQSAIAYVERFKSNASMGS